MNAIITQNSVIIPDSEVRKFYKELYQKLLKKLTIRTPQRIGPDKTIKIYKYDIIDGSRLLHIPRNTGYKLYSNGSIESATNAVPKGRKIDLKLNATLYDNQKIVVDYLMKNNFNDELREEGWATATLNMTAGMGKTFTVGGLINRLQLNTLYIVPREKLQQQAKEDLALCFPTANIQTPNGSKSALVQAATCDIMIMIINSACRMEDNFFAKFGLVVFDEVHTYCSSARSQIFWKAHTECVLGMSATTSDREDKFDPVYHKHLGEPIMAADIPGFDAPDANFIGKVKTIRYFASEEYSQNILSPVTGYVDFDKMLNQFMRDDTRNKLVVQEILKLYNDPVYKRYIMAFADRREHLEIINKLLIEEFKQKPQHDTDNDDIFMPELEPELVKMQGGSKQDILKKANHARIILTTYGYSGTGVSIVHINSLVFITPRKQGYKQICARGMRRGSDIKIPRYFIDIVDSGTSVKNQYYHRKQAYNYYNFEYAEDVKVDMREPE